MYMNEWFFLWWSSCQDCVVFALEILKIVWCSHSRYSRSSWGSLKHILYMLPVCTSLCCTNYLYAHSFVGLMDRPAVSVWAMMFYSTSEASWSTDLLLIVYQCLRAGCKLLGLESSTPFCLYVDNRKQIQREFHPFSHTITTIRYWSSHENDDRTLDPKREFQIDHYMTKNLVLDIRWQNAFLLEFFGLFDLSCTAWQSLGSPFKWFSWRHRWAHVGLHENFSEKFESSWNHISMLIVKW